MLDAPPLSARWATTAMERVGVEGTLRVKAWLDGSDGWCWSVMLGEQSISKGTGESTSELAQARADRALAWHYASHATATRGRDAGLVCPKCGYYGEREPAVGETVPFRYLEDVVVYRSVEGVVDGELRVCRMQTGEYYDCGKEVRLECCACGCEFPRPEDLAIDWR